MKYVYPAVLYPDDSKISVKVPDLPGCYTYGDDMADALLAARDAVEMWLWDAENKQESIPAPSVSLDVRDGETFTLIAADTDEYRKANDIRAVKKDIVITIVAQLSGRES